MKKNDSKKNEDCPEMILLAVPNVMGVGLIIWGILKTMYQTDLLTDLFYVVAAVVVVALVRNDIGAADESAESAMLVKDPVSILIVGSSSPFIRDKFEQFCHITTFVVESDDTSETLTEYCQQCKFVFVTEDVSLLLPFLTPENVVIDCSIGDSLLQELPKSVYVDAPIANHVEKLFKSGELYVGMSDTTRWKEVFQILSHLMPSPVLCGGLGSGRKVANIMLVKQISGYILECQCKFESKEIDSVIVEKLFGHQNLCNASALNQILNSIQHVEFLKGTFDVLGLLRGIQSNISCSSDMIDLDETIKKQL